MHVLEAWPSREQQFGKLSRPARPKVAKDPGPKHAPVRHGNVFRCLQCLRNVSDKTVTPCQSLSPTMSSLLRGGAGEGHKLHWARVVETDVPVIFCILCGGFASVKSDKLSKRCTNPKRSSERSKLLRGLLPGSSYTLGQAFPLSSLPVFPLPPLSSSPSSSSTLSQGGSL